MKSNVLSTWKGEKEVYIVLHFLCPLLIEQEGKLTIFTMEYTIVSVHQVSLLCDKRALGVISIV